MNRYNTLSYFGLVSLFFLVAQGVFAQDQITNQGGSSDYPLTLFGSEN